MRRDIKWLSCGSCNSKAVGKSDEIGYSFVLVSPLSNFHFHLNDETKKAGLAFKKPSYVTSWKICRVWYFFFFFLFLIRHEHRIADIKDEKWKEVSLSFWTCSIALSGADFLVVLVLNLSALFNLAVVSPTTRFTISPHLRGVGESPVPSHPIFMTIIPKLCFDKILLRVKIKWNKFHVNSTMAWKGKQQQSAVRRNQLVEFYHFVAGMIPLYLQWVFCTSHMHNSIRINAVGPLKRSSFTSPISFLS